MSTMVGSRNPRAGIIRLKLTDIKGIRSYDAGKKIKAHKRHILLDTIRNFSY